MDYHSVVEEQQKTEKEKLEEQSKQSEEQLFKLVKSKEKQSWLQQNQTKELINKLHNFRQNVLQEAEVHALKGEDKLAVSKLIMSRTLLQTIQDHIYARD